MNRPTSTKHFRTDYPPSANAYWRKTRTGRVYVSPKCKAFRQLVAVHSCGLRGLEGPQAVELIVQKPTGRKGGGRHDADNRCKVLLDACEAAGVFAVSDHQAAYLTIYGGPATPGGRALVWFTPIDCYNPRDLRDVLATYGSGAIR